MNNDARIEFLEEIKFKKDAAPGLSSFVRDMLDNPVVKEIAQNIYDRTIDWADRVGLTIKKPDEELHPKEEKWAAFFRDHKFSSLEESRLWADALELVTGESVSKYIKMDEDLGYVESYPSWICIVPVDSDNGHDYKLNIPVVNYRPGTAFIKPSGSSGNNMTKTLSLLRLPTLDEVTTLVCKLVYNSPGVTELMLNII